MQKRNGSKVERDIMGGYMNHNFNPGVGSSFRPYSSMAGMGDSQTLRSPTTTQNIKGSLVKQMMGSTQQQIVSARNYRNTDSQIPRNSPVSTCLHSNLQFIPRDPKSNYM